MKPYKLSTGADSTLGNWYDLCKAVFGEDSKPTVFIKEKMDKQGKEQPVVADETQLLFSLMDMFRRETADRPNPLERTIEDDKLFGESSVTVSDKEIVEAYDKILLDMNKENEK